VSDESGRREVYIRDVGGSGRRVRVSSGGGEILYRRGSQMRFVPASTKGELAVGAQSVLFDVPCDIDPFNNDVANHDVTKDGQRVILARRTLESGCSRQQLNLVVNWAGQSKRTVRARSRVRRLDLRNIG
jgi:hypothetical protein